MTSSFRPVVALAALCAVLFLAAGPRPSFAETSAGLRVGLGIDPDQVLVGGQVNLDALSEHVYIVPSAEAGFGDDAFTLSFNGDVQYRFDVQGSVRPYAGGGLTLFYYDLDEGRGDDTELGVAVLGGIFFGRAEGNPMFVEAKAGIGDIPEWKIMFGINF